MEQNLAKKACAKACSYIYNYLEAIVGSSAGRCRSVR